MKNVKQLNKQTPYQPIRPILDDIEPNQTAETVEWNRKMEEAGRWQAEQNQKDRLHRERLKQDRILKTPVDKYTHALDLIIERAESTGNGENITIRCYDFNFFDTVDDIKVLAHFLEKLRTKKCFESYAKGCSCFSFFKPNIKNLKKFKEKKKIKFINNNDEQIAEVEEMLDKLENDIKKGANPKAKYNNGILYLREKEIDFNKKQNQRDLLKTLFKEPTKNWSYDEIQEDWDTLKKLNLIKYPKNYWRKFYSAGDDINQAIAIETQIKNFITKNTKEIKINPKYIS